MKKFFLFICFFVFLLNISTLTYAQSTNDLPKINNEGLTIKDIVYEKEFYVGLLAHTQGFGLSANFVKINNIFTKSFYEIEIINQKHPREHRITSAYSSGKGINKGFYYGKQNSFYNINASIGRLKTIAEKGRRTGIQIALYYSAGASLGITKPYYLDIIYGINNGVFIKRAEKYNEQNAELFLNKVQVYSASGFTYGLNELKFYPGVQAKVGLDFDWSNDSKFVKALQVGAMLNAYLTDIPIMISEDNHFLFPNFYVKLSLGKRW